MIFREQIGTAHVEAVDSFDLYLELRTDQDYWAWLSSTLKPLKVNKDYIVIHKPNYKEYIISVEALRK